MPDCAPTMREFICPVCGHIQIIYVQIPPDVPGINVMCEGCGVMTGVNRDG